MIVEPICLVLSQIFFYESSRFFSIRGVYSLALYRLRLVMTWLKFFLTDNLFQKKIVMLDISIWGEIGSRKIFKCRDCIHKKVY